MAEKQKFEPVLSNARMIRLRVAGMHADALSSELQARLAVLDDDEIAVLSSIKQKLDAGLDGPMREAADTVGGFVW